MADLPDGLDTLFGSGGAKLTGSQAQQLALARVVLADPHTLILDEATALLDPSTAHNAELALAGVLVGRTVIAIAHRLQIAEDRLRAGERRFGRHAEFGHSGGRRQHRFGACGARAVAAVRTTGSASIR